MKDGHTLRTRTHLRAFGFSLLEVVIALVILGMITTALFAIIRGSVKGAADIERIQRENDQVHRFLELCRFTFQSLPNSATLSLTLVDSNIPEGPQELGIAGMPTAFAFGANPVSYQETVIGLGVHSTNPTFEDGTPRYNIGITRADIIPPTNTEDLGGEQTTNPENPPDEQGRYWMPLLRDVSNLHWRFWKESSDEWLDEWSETTLPDLIEVQLQMEGRLTPLRLVFALPIKTLREGRGQPQGTTGTTTTSSSSSSQGQQPSSTSQPTTPR